MFQFVSVDETYGGRYSRTPEFICQGVFKIPDESENCSRSSGIGIHDPWNRRSGLSGICGIVERKVDYVN